MSQVTRFRPEDMPPRKPRVILYSSIRASIRAYFTRRKVETCDSSQLREETGFQDLPIEVRHLIWEYATQRIHELHPAKKHQKPKTYLLMDRDMHGRLTLQSNNQKFPATMSICKESREVALKMLSVFSFHLHPHLKSWRMDHTCVKVKPFVFSPSHDTLYLGGLAGIWISEKWAKPTPPTDDHWLPGIFKGWENVAFDYRAAVWMGVHQFRTDSIQRLPRHNFKDIFPSLKHVSTVIDTTEYIVTHMTVRESRVYPPYEGTSFVKSTDDEMRNASHDLGHFINSTLHWESFFDHEYGDEERPTIDAQKIMRKGKEKKKDKKKKKGKEKKNENEKKKKRS